MEEKCMTIAFTGHRPETIPYTFEITVINNQKCAIQRHINARNRNMNMQRL